MALLQEERGHLGWRSRCEGHVELLQPFLGESGADRSREGRGSLYEAHWSRRSRLGLDVGTYNCRLSTYTSAAAGETFDESIVALNDAVRITVCRGRSGGFTLPAADDNGRPRRGHVTRRCTPSHNKTPTYDRELPGSRFHEASVRERGRFIALPKTNVQPKPKYGHVNHSKEPDRPSTVQLR